MRPIVWCGKKDLERITFDFYLEMSLKKPSPMA